MRLSVVKLNIRSLSLAPDISGELVGGYVPGVRAVRVGDHTDMIWCTQATGKGEWKCRKWFYASITSGTQAATVAGHVDAHLQSQHCWFQDEPGITCWSSSTMPRAGIYSWWNPATSPGGA